MFHYAHYARVKFAGAEVTTHINTTSLSTLYILLLTLSLSLLTSRYLSQSRRFSCLNLSEIAAMDAVLRQSKSMCPFLKKTSPATLRSLSTTTRNTSPGGGSMSNLQTIARRCPVMGKALAVQTTNSGKIGLGGVAALGAIRAFSGKVNSGKARLHTSRSHEARAVENGLFVPDNGRSNQLLSTFNDFEC